MAEHAPAMSPVALVDEARVCTGRWFHGSRALQLRVRRRRHRPGWDGDHHGSGRRAGQSPPAPPALLSPAGRTEPALPTGKAAPGSPRSQKEDFDRPQPPDRSPSSTSWPHPVLDRPGQLARRVLSDHLQVEDLSSGWPWRCGLGRGRPWRAVPVRSSQCLPARARASSACAAKAATRSAAGGRSVMRSMASLAHTGSEGTSPRSTSA